jgi:methionine-rich copper-binding protein CopC
MAKAQRLFYSRILVASFAFAVLCASPGTSWGHAFPDHSDPKVGSTVSPSPSVVRIWFDSELEPAFSNLMVHSMDGRMVDKRDSRVDSSDPKLLEVSVPPLPPGTYLVIWNVVARDTHRTQGQFTFTIK